MNPEELAALKKYISKPGSFIEKEYVFSREDAVLPPIDSLFESPEYTLSELTEMKKMLSDTKNLLDHYDLAEWGTHTNYTSLTSLIVRELRKKIAPELCTIAWTKMYEMLYAYELCGKDREKEKDKVKTLHVCEAPGGFICATNHYLKREHGTSEKPVEWDWRGLSLNPYYEGGILFKFILRIYFRIKLIK